MLTQLIWFCKLWSIQFKKSSLLYSVLSNIIIQSQSRFYKIAFLTKHQPLFGIRITAGDLPGNLFEEWLFGFVDSQYIITQRFLHDQTSDLTLLQSDWIKQISTLYQIIITTTTLTQAWNQQLIVTI